MIRVWNGATWDDASTRVRVAGDWTVPIVESSILPVQSQVVAEGNASTLTATFDATPTEGNLLIAVHAARSSSRTYTIPAGWTLNHEHTNNRVRVFSKPAGASESASVTVETSGGTAHQVLAVYEYEGLTEYDVSVEAEAASATSHTTGTTGTTTAADTLVVAAVSLDAEYASWDTGSWTNDFTHSVDIVTPSVGGARCALGIALRVAGETGTFSTQTSWSPARASYSIVAAFK